jgi:hypothetical protein
MRVPAIALLVVLLASACSGVLRPEYEYEEELYLSLDGSAQVNVNASVAALVALRGADLDVNPRARVDREQVRALFQGPGVVVSTPTFSRRAGRRFVHVRVNVPDIRQLARAEPFSWSTYRFDRKGDAYQYRQVVGGPTAANAAALPAWTGNEIVAFRIHVPSAIVWHNTPSRQVERGNILEWTQPLGDRVKGEPLHLEVHMQPETILHTTLILFASTIVAAALVFATAIWWMTRRGREAEMVESRS